MVSMFELRMFLRIFLPTSKTEHPLEKMIYRENISDSMLAKLSLAWATCTRRALYTGQKGFLRELQYLHYLAIDHLNRPMIITNTRIKGMRLFCKTCTMIKCSGIASQRTSCWTAKATSASQISVSPLNIICYLSNLYFDQIFNIISSYYDI